MVGPVRELAAQPSWAFLSLFDGGRFADDRWVFVLKLGPGSSSLVSSEFDLN